MTNSIVLSTSYNYFGDTVLTFPDEDRDYNMFQYNCRGAKDLLERLLSLVVNGSNVFVSEDDGMGHINIQPAVPYVERIIKLNDDVAELERIHQHSFSCDGPGAEIAGHYGY